MHTNKFAHWLSWKEGKLLWEHPAERRHIYSEIGRNEPCPCKSGRE
ncbi:MAG: SEC-C metal-binding domain-containing protein [Chthoniobacterales bacterium]